MNQSTLPRPSLRVSRSYAELELPLPIALATTLPVVFVEPESSMQIYARDLSSSIFCAALPGPITDSIPRYISFYLTRVLDGAENTEWLSLLVVPWRPYFLTLFSISAQRKMRAEGLTALEQDLPLLSLVNSCIRKVADFHALLAISERRGTFEEGSVPVQITLNEKLPFIRKRVQRRVVALEAPQKWRADPHNPFCLEYADGTKIEHTDPRYGWWIHLLANSIPQEGPLKRQLAAEEFLATCERDLPKPYKSISVTFRASVAAAEQMTVEQEISDLVAILGRATRDRSRTAEQLRLRFGTNGKLHSFGDLANVFGIARSQVSKQIELARNICPRNAYAPALRALVALIDTKPSRQIDASAAELRQLLGPNQSLEGALQFAREFLQLPTRDVFRATPLGASTYDSFLDKEAALQTSAIMSKLNASTAQFGVAYADDLVCHRPNFRPTDNDRGYLEDAIANDATLDWLSSDQRWILWNTAQSPLAKALAQAMHVAYPHPLPVDDAANVLRATLDLGLSAVQPDLNTLRAAVNRLAEATGHSFDTEFVYLLGQGQPLTLMTDFECKIFSSLVEFDGFAKVSVLQQHCGYQGQQTAKFISRLYECTFLIRENSGYRLCGWPAPDPEQFTTAHSVSSRPRLYKISDALVEIIMKQSNAQRVNASTRMIYLPTPLDTLVEGDFADSTQRWPNINISKGRVRKLSSIAEALGVAPGRTFKLVLNLDNKQYLIDKPELASGF